MKTNLVISFLIFGVYESINGVQQDSQTRRLIGACSSMVALVLNTLIIMGIVPN